MPKSHYVVPSMSYYSFFVCVICFLFFNSFEQLPSIRHCPQEFKVWDFPGDPVGETPLSQCRGPGLIPAQGTRCHMHAKTKKPVCRN